MSSLRLRRSARPLTAVLTALLALLIQSLIPPGYMLAAGPASPAAVVICTGHGPLRLAAQTDRQAPPAKQKAAGLCAFAGHAAAPLLASPRLPTEIRWTRAVLAGPAVHPSVFVGRGLAAPPPARGPPSTSA